MESILKRIEPFIEPCVHIISSLIHAQVTVADEKLTRVCGSDYYHQDYVKTTASHVPLWKHFLETQTPGIILDTMAVEGCKQCRYRARCETLGAIGYPITYQGSVVGVIGITATTEQEYDTILENQEQLLKFLKYIDLLIVGQIQSVAYSDQLSQQLSAVSRQHTHTDIIAESPRMREVLALANRVAPSDSTVLITGESGTGKEELAKYLHAHSRRRNGPMISINCGAIPEHLVESELFGYEGGSFTGAKRTGAVGKIELANGGTLFLDEVGELPLAAQTKLLRFLQERSIERVGGSKSIPVDTRVISATNQDLERMLEKHTFRQDLYYRLNVIPIKMPPLRERGVDILLLANYFLDHYNKKMGRSLLGFTPDAEVVLRTYHWPGNVRELRNVVEYLVNISGGSYISSLDMPGHLRRRRAADPPAAKTLGEMVRDYERSVLSTYTKDAVTKEQKLQCARQLGVSPATLYRKLAAYHL